MLYNYGIILWLINSRPTQAANQERPTNIGDKIKPEMLQPTIELVSDVYPDITSARTAMHQQRAALAKFMHEQGIALISAGTHPSALWQEQKITEGERYIRQIKEEQVIYKKLSVC